MVAPNDAPAWVKLHNLYFGNRFTEAQYRIWSEILTRERFGTHEMLLDAVNEMIRSGFSGYLEAHFKYLAQWVARQAGRSCYDCGGSGLVSVPNRRTPEKSAKIHVLCRCPHKSTAMRRYASAATLDQYEQLYGDGWRRNQLEARNGSGEVRIAGVGGCESALNIQTSLGSAFARWKDTMQANRRREAESGVVQYRRLEEMAG
jgi:hypothetical protein